MKSFFAAFAIFLVLVTGVFAGTSPNPGADTVPICHTPPSHDFTLWVAPDAVPAHLAHGDYLGECSDDDTNVTTTTTVDTTTTTEDPCPDVPIENDPAYLNWDGLFFIHGSINPNDDDLTDIGGFGITLATDPDGIFLATGCVLGAVSDKAWRCSTPDVKVAVKRRMDATRGVYYTFKVKGTPPWTDPTTKAIKTRVSFACVGGANDAQWSGTLGEKIWVKY